MAAFFIAQYQVNDADLYATYSAGAGPTLAQYGGELVAAKTWYQSEEYQAVVGKRLAATAGFSVISEAMNLG